MNAPHFRKLFSLPWAGLSFDVIPLISNVLSTIQRTETEWSSKECHRRLTPLKRVHLILPIYGSFQYTLPVTHTLSTICFLAYPYKNFTCHFTCENSISYAKKCVKFVFICECSISYVKYLLRTPRFHT